MLFKAARPTILNGIEDVIGRSDLTKAAELVETAVEETLAYYVLSRGALAAHPHQQSLERILREIRRHTRVVGSFPDGQSALNLLRPGCGTSPAPLGRPNAT